MKEGYRTILVSGVNIETNCVTANLLWPTRTGTDAAPLRIPNEAIHSHDLAILRAAKPEDIVLLLVREEWALLKLGRSIV